MIHIFLLIAKIIGIILLTLLGILLLLLLAVLFIPVRYWAEGAYDDKERRISLRVSWFLRLVSFKAGYGGDGFSMSLRICGFPLWRKKKEDAMEEAEDGAETILDEAEHSLYRELERDEEEYRKAYEDDVRNDGRREDAGGNDGRQESAGRNDTGRNDAGRNDGRQESAGRNDVRREDANQNDARRNSPNQNPFGSQDADTAAPGGGSHAGVVSRFSARIKKILEKLKFFFRRICDKLKGIRDFGEEKKRWLEDSKNQASIKLLLRQARRLAAHIWPRKGKLAVTYGFDDPYTTGQVLQAASLVYPFYHEQLELHPVFDGKALDARGSLRGRIRLSVLLWLAFRIFFDKHTRRMLRGFIK